MAPATAASTRCPSCISPMTFHTASAGAACHVASRARAANTASPRSPRARRSRHVAARLASR
eukprot:10065803-Alexandrium_andersonii.AAC.1